MVALPAMALPAMAQTAMVLPAMAQIAIVPAKRPNIVFIIADDQDKLLGGETPIPMTRSHLREGGMRAENFFVGTPWCCPSRTQFLTGRYYHNLYLEPVPGKTGTGHGCMNQNSTNVFNNQALFPQLHKAGYKTGHFGKLINDQDYYWCSKGNSTAAIAAGTNGFTHISTSCASTGAYWTTSYVVKDDDKSALRYEHLNASDASTYSTAQFGNRSISWIKSVAADSRTSDSPFFAYIGLMAPHLPAQPAPWHAKRYPNGSSPDNTSGAVIAPRTENFNELGLDHYHLVATATELDEPVIEFIDQHMRNRWRSLLAVDDVVHAIVVTLEQEQVLNNTYVFYTADHGYHLGQFRIPDEKMMPYDTDVRVPFYVKGPGIAPNSTMPQLIGNSDMAPTILELAGIPTPALMDGRSFARFLHTQQREQQQQQQQKQRKQQEQTHGHAHGEGGGWRGMWLSQLANPSHQVFGTNKVYFDDGTLQGVIRHPPMGRADDPSEQFVYDDSSNDWRLLRVLNATHDLAYIEFGPTAAAPTPAPTPSPIKPSRFMPHTNVEGPNEHQPCLEVAYSNASLCQRDCDADDNCVAWTHHLKASVWRCCHKPSYHGLAPAPATTTSGVKNPKSASSDSSDPAPYFHELYDLKADHEQRHNLWSQTPGSVQKQLEAAMATYFQCKGIDCP